MDILNKLDIIYSYKVHDPFIIKTQDSLNGNLVDMLKFLADSEQVTLDNRDLSRISRSLDLIGGNIIWQSNIDLISRGEDVYGEVTRLGVNVLYSEIMKLLGGDVKNLNFIDLGMGKGKLVLHLSLLSDFKTLTGVEISEAKYAKSLEIMEHARIFDSRIYLQNCSMFEMDLKNYDVLFFNDLCFNQNLRNYIFNKISTGSLIIVSKKCDLQLVNEIDLQCSWTNSKQFFIYRK